MADEGGARSRSPAGARTWPVGRARHDGPAVWPWAEFAIPARLREWAAVEAGAGRLLPWFAVGFGSGIVLYFTAEHEPSVWAASALAIAAIVIAVLLRRRQVGFVVGLGFVAVAGGFAVATLKTALIDHTVLHYPGIMAQPPQAT